jgi:hypothetical protein
MYHNLIRNTETGEYYQPVFVDGAFTPAWVADPAKALRYARCSDDKRFDRTLKAKLDAALTYLAGLGFAVEVA